MKHHDRTPPDSVHEQELLHSLQVVQAQALVSMPIRVALSNAKNHIDQGAFTERPVFVRRSYIRQGFLEQQVIS